MHVQRLRRRLQRRQPVMVILRVEIADMAHLRHRPAHVKAVLARADRVIIRHRPAIRAGHQAHPVRAQHMQLPRQRAAIRAAHRLDIAIPAQQYLPVKRLQHIRLALRRVGPRQQRQHRMHLMAPAIIMHLQRQRRRRLDDHPDAAINHRVAQVAVARQGAGVARAPCHAARAALPRHHAGGGAGLALAGGPARRRRPRAAPKHLQYHAFLAPRCCLAWCHLRQWRLARHHAGKPLTTPDHSARILGSRHLDAGAIITSCNAHTSASTRSGLPRPSKPCAVIAHISSSSAASPAPPAC